MSKEVPWGGTVLIEACPYGARNKWLAFCHLRKNAIPKMAHAHAHLCAPLGSKCRVDGVGNFGPAWALANLGFGTALGQEGSGQFLRGSGQTDLFYLPDLGLLCLF